MFRYLALAWSASDEQQGQAAQQITRRLGTSGSWQQVFDAGGLRVFCADARARSLHAQILPAQRGVILGSLYRRHQDLHDDSFAPPAVLTEAEAHATLTSRGRWLIEHCWGNYVAFLADANAAGKWVLKDPTGNLPCYCTRIERITVVFSALQDCLALRTSRFTLNRRYLQARVLGGLECLQHRPLNEVEQVQRGQCVEIGTCADTLVRSRLQHWNPLVFADSLEPIEDPELASQAMRAVVRACTRTLAGAHERLLLRLSGGLDSSIIAGCLKGAPAHTICYTYYNPDGRSDERPWARLASQHGGHEHIEYPIRPADIPLQMLLECPPLVEPTPCLGFLHRSTLEQQLAHELQATAVFNGDGGDSGFCSDSLAYAVPEFLRRHGLRREALQLASRVALRRQQSTWEVLRHALRVWLLGAGMKELVDLQRVLAQLPPRELREHYQMPARYPHPWFEHLRRVPWGTIKRLGMLLHSPEFYNVASTLGSPPEVVSPLYSQPVIELLLRIPLHRHFEAGRDRGLARRTFAAEVPEPILRRLWKDRGPGFHDELLHLNRDFLRSLFLEGVLVREGMLDRGAVEQAFSTQPSKDTVLSGEIFKHLELELWARHWL